MMDRMNNLLAVEKSATRLEGLKSARQEKSRIESGKSEDFANELGAELMQASAMAQAAALPRPEASPQAVTVSLSGKAPGAKASGEASGLAEKEAGKGLSLGNDPMVVTGSSKQQLQQTQQTRQLQTMQTVAQTQAQTQATGKGPTLKGNEKAGANRLQSNAEKTPLSMDTAASTNTAAAIAGLKPWSKDWVFDGPTLKDIQNSIQNPTPDLTGAMESLKGLEAQLSEQGARIETNPRARGDAQMQAGIENVALQGTTLKAQRPMGNSSLSGNEFVATLSALRGGAEGGAAVSRLPFGQTGKQDGEGHTGQGFPQGVKNRKANGASFEEKGLESLNEMPRGLEPGMLHVPAREFASPSLANRPMTEVTGHVVKGAMSQDRLSTESLQGITGGIRNFSAHGGGEMKVRLRPDHLGELTIRVTTQGNQVGLKIQASSEESKKILEESLSHLKESMATQKLDLSQVDFSVAKLAGGNTAGDPGMDNSNRNHSQQFQGAWADQGNAFGNLGNPAGQNRGGWGQGLYESSERGVPAGGAVPNPGLGRGSMGSMSGTAAASGRLDVRA